MLIPELFPQSSEQCLLPRWCRFFWLAHTGATTEETLISRWKSLCKSRSAAHRTEYPSFHLRVNFFTIYYVDSSRFYSSGIVVGTEKYKTSSTSACIRLTEVDICRSQHVPIRRWKMPRSANGSSREPRTQWTVTRTTAMTIWVDTGSLRGASITWIEENCVVLIWAESQPKSL